MSDMTFAEAAEVLKRDDVSPRAREDAIEVALRALEQVEIQGQVIVNLNRDMKTMRKAMNGQSEYKYLGGDLISREALIERIEMISWYHEDECGKSTVMRQGACSEEEAWFKAPDIFAAVRDALAVEAEPVVHAHWIRVGWGYYKCSHCEAEVGVVSGHKNYCANCGAHMDEEVACE